MTMNQKMESEPTTSRMSDNSLILENQLLSQCQKIQGMITQLLIEQNCLMNLMTDFVCQRQNSESNNNPPNAQNESSLSEDQEEKLKKREEILEELEQIIENLNEMKTLDGLKKTTATNVTDTTNWVLAKIFPYDIAACMNWSGTGKYNKIVVKNNPQIINPVKDIVRKQCKDANDQEIEEAIKLWFQRKRTGNWELRKSLEN